MKTKIYNFKNIIEYKDLEEASSIIKNGGLVAIPTETVYGLAADGLNPEALEKIFIAKNRPMDNPLILHISDIFQVYELTKDVKETDIEILKKLWPGPLTVILNRSDIVPDEVTAGLDTVAIRMPDNKITRSFIKICDTPLAAPSANLSTKPSPTTADAVYEDMNGRIDAIIDGGPCTIGIESTVLDLTEEAPKILRPGYYTKEMLEKYWEIVYIDLGLNDKNITPKSPGQKYKHYAPNAEVLVLIGDDDSFRKEVNKLLLENESKKIGLMVFDNDKKLYNNKDVIYMGEKEDLSYMGKILFDSLRKMDENGVELIIVRGVEEDGYGLSIMNRLKKAASQNVRRI
ncbi:L-threonylcarbamoyladenylate synthase [Helcococcus kunzii]|uniref:Threonylcarbamoyl-AMP synthase n=1 Tax=Helcococcus kunzii ATCC 51366 TaxID=883114 RepID=H3NL24_9FIRM|nr:L-threonylcarbamoyladenylate synthase [Helcococcus kunzii]EHR36280.1 Sua5/YciO/YrdC/YwlC family protein [Helcococcus kunzii ATCC 51366]